MVDVQLESALDFLNPSTLDFDEWLRVMMGWKYEGGGYENIDAWNRRDPGRYDERENHKTWESISNDKDSPTTGGTIIYMAEQQGWVRPTPNELGEHLVLGQLIRDDQGNTPRQQTPARQQPPIEIYGLPKFGTLPEPCSMEPLEIDPADQLKKFVSSVYKPGECINVVREVRERDGKKLPYGFGDTFWPDQLIFNAGQVLGGCNAEAGAWVRINPVTSWEERGEKTQMQRQNGEKRDYSYTDADVTAYRNALVECDDLPTEQQLDLMRRLQLPVRCFVRSGNKSIHAVVAVDASNAGEYRERVRALYDYCEANGLPVDKTCRNPSRLMRLAGAKRGEKEQTLLATNVGPRLWDEFLFCVQGLAERQSAEQEKGSGIKLRIVSTDRLTGANVCPRPRAIIEGIMSAESIMMVAAPSKAGKTWQLIDLAWCLASGTRWMGRFQCEKSRVLYINAELSEEWLSQRLDAIKQRVGDFEGVCFDTLTTRGDLAMDISSLHDQLVTECANAYDVIIIDPIYLFEDGPENDQETIINLMRLVGDIRFRCNCSIIFSHHFAKGNPALKEAMDRAAGSGVFQRFYDQGITLTPLQVLEGTEAHTWLTNNYGDNARCFEFSTTSRNYPDASLKSVIWSWPRFYADSEGVLDSCPLRGSNEARRAKGGKATTDKHAKQREQKDEATRRAIEACKSHEEEFTKKNVYKRLKKECERLHIDYPSLSTFQTGWTKRGGQTSYRSDPKREHQLFRVDIDAVDEDGNSSEPWLAVEKEVEEP